MARITVSINTERPNLTERPNHVAAQEKLIDNKILDVLEKDVPHVYDIM